jgi:hypothetical protein
MTVFSSSLKRMLVTSGSRGRMTERIIARMLGVSNGVVHGYVRRARLAGLSWPLPESVNDEGLELLLFPAPTAASQSDRRPAPDWVYVEKELRRCESARGPDADRHAKLLIHLAVEGSTLGSDAISMMFTVVQVAPINLA